MCKAITNKILTYCKRTIAKLPKIGGCTYNQILFKCIALLDFIYLSLLTTQICPSFCSLHIILLHDRDKF